MTTAHGLRRRIALLVTALGVVALLAACLPDEPKSRTYARLQSGEVQIVVCADLQLTRVRVQVAKDDGQDYEPVWDIRGSASLPAGDVLTIGSAPEGMSSDGSPDLSPATQKIQVSFYSDADGQIVSEIGVFKAGLLRSGEWVDQVGHFEQVPCEDV